MYFLFQNLLRETGCDVRIPAVTVRNSSGFEIRSQGSVYDILQKLKNAGFHAVLGQTMANEFNYQAVRVYVEHALQDLGFLPANFSKYQPLLSLQTRQQQLYSTALQNGFTPSLPPGATLSRQLSLPLTWEREKELIAFLRQHLDEQQFTHFCLEHHIDDEYFSTREVVEIILNFASQWLFQFRRADTFPVYQSLQSRSYLDFSSTRSSLDVVRGGEYAISTQAQQHFESAQQMWDDFLTVLRNQDNALSNAQLGTKIHTLVDLAHHLVQELKSMSDGFVTQWAKEIIQGKMAAVGKDITTPIYVHTFEDFYNALQRLLDTARLVLVYRSQKGEFGWEVSTDRAEGV